MLQRRPETGNGPQRTLNHDLLLPCGFLPVTPTESEPNTQAVRRQRTRQKTKGNCLDRGNEDVSQPDSEEYHYNGQRNLRMETPGFHLTSETMLYLPKRIELDEKVTAQQQSPFCGYI